MRPICGPILLVLTLALWQAAQSQETQEANAAELVRSAQRAAGRVVAAARTDTSLAADRAEAKPFWEGMKTVIENLETALSSLESRDEHLFAALANSVSGFAQAQIALIMNESTDRTVASGMETLGGVLETLHEHYSKEAARLERGGELTAAEREQLRKLIAQQDELMRKLDEVERNVAKSSDAMRQGIDEIRQNSTRIRNAPYTVAGFTSGLFQCRCR